MHSIKIYSSLSIILIYLTFSTGFKDDECEVCVKTVEKFAQTLSDEDLKDTKKIEDSFRQFCKTAGNKEQRLCYYLGGAETSATGILSELSKPLSWSMPAEKICSKLEKKDAQICELRYEKQIDLNSVDIKKLKVKDLKKILNDFDETCEGCIEKIDYIKKVEYLKEKSNRKEL